MKKVTLYFLVSLALLLVIACAREVTQEELIRDAVDIKIKQWQESQKQQAREKALKKAEHDADSILVSTALEDKLDTIPKPEKPVKPLKPVFKVKPDTVIVDPIYKKDEKN